MPSLYKKYREKITQCKVYERPHYFFEYLVADNVLVIKHLYNEQPGKGHEIYKAILDLASRNKCTLLTGHIHIDNPNFLRFVAKLERLGFKMIKQSNELLCTYKELEWHD